MTEELITGIADVLRRDGICIVPELFESRAVLGAYRAAASLSLVQDEAGAKRLFDNADSVEQFGFFFRSELLVRLFHGLLGENSVSRRNRVQLRTDQTQEISPILLFHIDSVLSRYKVFLYLTDVSDADGPLEYMRGTHFGDWREPYLEEVRDAMRGNKKTDIEGLDYNGCLRTPEEVNAVTSKFAKVSVTGPRGTCVIFDTGGFHRAAPFHSGTRLVLSMDWMRVQDYS